MIDATYTRQTFLNVLEQPMEIRKFYICIAALIESDPFFMPAYRELFWYAEKRHDVAMKEKVLHQFLHAYNQLLANPKKIEARMRDWTVLEKNALLDMFDCTIAHSGFSIPQKVWFRMQKSIARAVCTPGTKSSTHESRHLKKIEDIDITRLLQELKSIAPYWWHIDTERKEQVLHHKHTWALVIRNRIYHERAYQPVDGVHESVPSEYASLCERTHACVLELAEKLDIGLGRVAVVKLDPYQQAYRHYDSEPYLRDRKRYHLVLAAGAHNILESGGEAVNARPGELWFFDNAVMHRAENRSPHSRVHIIFDGYPLSP